MAKNSIQEVLIDKGRKLIQEKGYDALTARKLSESSGYSVGTIYNQFGNMDNYILLQNYITLDELYNFLQKARPAKTAYVRINNFLDAFVTFVMNNPQIWFLLFTFHLKRNPHELSKIYLRKIAMILKVPNAAFAEMFPSLSKKEKNVLLQALWMSVFSLSSFLSCENTYNFSKKSKQAICKTMLNAFLCGIISLQEN